MFPESSIDRGGNGERNYFDFILVGSHKFTVTFFIPFSPSLALRSPKFKLNGLDQSYTYMSLG